MNTLGDKALLPAGLQDILPPVAAHEAGVVERLIGAFEGWGYERVKPPLLEFEDALLSGTGQAVAQQTFRLMDPVSHRMLGLRADMTPQVVRIAGTRLRNAPRPLRLCYGGQVLQVKGSQLRPERQFGQVGAELIGASQERADAEVVLLAARALEAVGVQGLSVDLNLPPLVGALAKDLGFDDLQSSQLREALDRKDAASVAQLAGDRSEPFLALLRAAGPADEALKKLESLRLPSAADIELSRLKRVVGLIRAEAADVALTLDPVEHRGFEYQTGISFVVFARNVRGELGRGGRYDAEIEDGSTESCTGFTLFMDTVLRSLPKPAAVRRLFTPIGADSTRVASLQSEGWNIIGALDEAEDPHAEAERLLCSHVLNGDAIELVRAILDTEEE
ncbi:ATP phosphoribosyltransferase regulatory subunit [Pelagibius sp. Alg239-R121]|uniref:ATP phosphoribosyltransferase regulatory subunit n=1 Tax=Pelagibius sp. Alg239-R121 TaxID=2993448 RepID=UPI0024A7A254|nr:ATP phosphoribosyltransferase regulatory subunit [Pelagibius sp. Alg239-R121]